MGEMINQLKGAKADWMHHWPSAYDVRMDRHLNPAVRI
jgi:hypothetical protein